jgi:5-methylcytosine-specific restriction endonuclease McrA
MHFEHIRSAKLKRAVRMNLTKANKLASERDEDTCQLCGKRAVEVHHIVPAGMGGKRVNELYNMLCLCDECHKLAHRSRKTRERLEDWSRERYGPVIDELIMKKRGGRGCITKSP